MYCKSCGKQIDDDSEFCSFCGTKLSASFKHTENPIQQTEAKKKENKKVKENYDLTDKKNTDKNESSKKEIRSKKINKVQAEHDYKFASFGQRVFARLIDMAIVSLAATFLYLILLNVSPDRASIIGESGSALTLLIFCFLYQPILESEGGTWGKDIIGIRTINLDTGKAPAIGNSYNRSILYFLYFLALVIPALLSCLAILWTKKKQTWHDSQTNIAVIKKKSITIQKTEQNTYIDENTVPIYIEESDNKEIDDTIETKKHQQTKKYRQNWKCKKCSEVNENNFNVCWNCNTSKDGTPLITNQSGDETEYRPGGLTTSNDVQKTKQDTYVNEKTIPIYIEENADKIIEASGIIIFTIKVTFLNSIIGHIYRREDDDKYYYVIPSKGKIYFDSKEDCIKNMYFYTILPDSRKTFS